MFADDIALIAESKEQLETIMKITYEYSQKWRFMFNYDKCAVMIFAKKVKEIKYGNCSKKCSCNFHWKLGDVLIRQVNVYKYLGIELDPH